MASDTTSFTTASCRNRKPDTCRRNRHENRFAKYRLPLPHLHCNRLHLCLRGRSGLLYRAYALGIPA